MIDEEIQRRAEWHQVCVALKKEEILVQQRKSEFWAKATEKLDGNMAIIFDSFPACTFMSFTFQISQYR